MNKLTEQEYVRKPDGGLAEQIEVLEAFAAGDADNTELLMLLIELRSLRAELAAIKSQEIVGYYYEMKKQNGDWVSRVTDVIPTSHDTEVSNIQALTFATWKMGQAHLSRHIFAVLVNELRDVPAIGCKRALIIGVLNRYGITAEPV
ncbi:Uncharacterised protein [Yersinia rohdei]|uniref:hypothetical protein n=1 Tax=Yersinia rohdei TaxID=29485 RepID=UPI00061C0EF8|nr:hypothetical protein [Yersinia rohdei]CNF17502.1 Uncharacterised protein [Yersinia rohdei]